MKSHLSLENIIYWNRKFHIYIGLFLLFFILFFSVSGLLLNNSKWVFASYWKERKETKIVTQVTIPANQDSSVLIQHFMSQLKLSGEISNVKLTPETIYFRTMRPGFIEDINVDLKSRLCIRKEIVYNWWGKIKSLHTFNGSDKVHSGFKPNWYLTNIWRLVMDIVAAGLIYLCISSWIMWYEIRKSYSAGIIALLVGIAGAIFFIFLLRIL
jgi:hypothetical protein